MMPVIFSWELEEVCSECPKSNYFSAYVIYTLIVQKGPLEFVILLNSKTTLTGKIRNLEAIFAT